MIEVITAFLHQLDFASLNELQEECVPPRYFYLLAHSIMYCQHDFPVNQVTASIKNDYFFEICINFYIQTLLYFPSKFSCFVLPSLYTVFFHWKKIGKTGAAAVVINFHSVQGPPEFV